MKIVWRNFAVSLLALTIASCGGTQRGVNQVDPVGSNTLQLAVGVATVVSNGAPSKELNIVATLRQSDGLSGSLYNVPTITMPPAMSNPVPNEAGNSSAVNPDFGTNRITNASLQGSLTNFVYPTLLAAGGQTHPYTPSTTGAFGYGLCTCNADSGPTNGFSPLYVQPDDRQRTAIYYGGPPAFPPPDPSLIGLFYLGYSFGFVTFPDPSTPMAPQQGVYRLDVAFPPNYETSVNAQMPSLSATAQLTNVTGLPPFATPSFVSDGLGGGKITATIPQGVTEAFAFVQAKGIYPPSNAAPGANPACVASHSYDQFYTVRLPSTGTVSVTLPDNAGHLDPSGAPSPSLCSGELFFVYAAGFDYPAFESAYPNNLSQSPAIANAAGQADVTLSAVSSEETY